MTGALMIHPICGNLELIYAMTLLRFRACNTIKSNQIGTIRFFSPLAYSLQNGQVQTFLRRMYS